MPYLRRVTFHKLDNVVPGTELTFGPKGAVLLGKNGTGKTTLLNAIVAVLHGDFDALGKGDFDVEIELLGEAATCVASLRSTAQTRGIPSELEDRFSPETVRLAQAVTLTRNLSIRLDSPDGNSLLVEVDGGKCRYKINNQSPEEFDEMIPIATQGPSWLSALLPLIFRGSAPEGTIQRASVLLAGSILALWRFDESLGMFLYITRGENERSQPGIIVDVLNGKINAWMSRVCGEDTSRSLRSAADALEGIPGQTIETGDSVLLRKFCELSAFDKGSLLVHQKLSKRDPVDNDKSGEQFFYSPFSFHFWKGRNSFSHDSLSFGQKRLLSFLWYLDANRDYVIADELVNGMHYDWIEHCMKEMESRQAFLSSQNPLLFDFMTFESAEDVRGRFVRCELDDEGRFRWTNLSPAESEDIFHAYDAGIQHVGEILRTRGYW